MSPRAKRYAAIAAVALLALIVFRRHEPPPDYFTADQVARGNLRYVMHEMGTLTPREAVVVKVPFAARIEFIVEDGSWVEKNDVLFILNEDDELKRAADERTQLMSLRQDLDLALMKRAQASDTEGQKRDWAKRAYELEQIRHRILTDTPAYGDELIKLHHQLKPLEEETADVRMQYEAAQDAYQAARDAEYDALDAVQANKDGVMRAQARIDELSVIADDSPEKLKASERMNLEEAKKELSAMQESIKGLKEKTAGLEEAYAIAQKAKEALRGPRDEIAAALAKREENEKEIYIRIEIEKRGLPLTMLRLDEESSRLALEEARRRLEQGKLSFAAGAISQSALDELTENVTAQSNKHLILREKLAVAERPLAPEVLLEAQLKLQSARDKAEKADETYARTLALQDQEIKVLRAREQRLVASIDTRSRHFPAIIESNIQFSEKELAELGDDKSGRRAEIEADLKRMREDLQASRDNPPNVERAPVSGIVTLMRENGDRPRQAGDQAWDQDALVEISPPENMEVSVKVNEVNIQHLSPGMPAGIEIPALKNLQCEAEVYQISGIGRDKFALSGQPGFADVTQYDVRLKLKEARADFRQGMSVLVNILAGEKKDVLWLPLGAATKSGEGWTVLTGGNRSPKPTPVEGEPFGPDAFIVTGGLKEGDAVYTRRVRNL